MRVDCRVIGVVATSLLTLSGWSAAQGAIPGTGGCVVVGQTVGPMALTVNWYSHDGQQTGSFFGSSRLVGPGGITPAPQNNGVLLTCVSISSPFTPELHQVARAGQVSKVAALPAFLQRTPALLLDQQGDLLILNDSQNAATGGIYRRSCTNGAITTVATGIPDAVAMEEDPATGELLVADVQGNVVRVAWNGTVVSIGTGALPAKPGGAVAKMHTDFTDGSVLVTWEERVMRFQPSTGKAASILMTGNTVHVGLDHDPVHGGYYRLDTTGLCRYDPRTAATKSLATFPGQYMPSDVAAWDSRALTGGGTTPVPGTAYRIGLALPAEAGRAYAAAASFGTTLGIPTPAGRIPLDPDPLFFISTTNPFLFRNFSNVLGANGTAVLTVWIPKVAGLRGLRFFVAAITHDTGGIRRITEPFGVAIR